MLRRLTELDPGQFGPLLAESQREGFRFLTRLQAEWTSGVNRFNQPGEALFGLFIEGKMAGIGGVNRQDDLTGRLRRFYVLPSQRRRGLGTLLLQHILEHSARHFRSVVLHTDTELGDCFYRAHNFTRVVGSGDVTHRIELDRAP